MVVTSVNGFGKAVMLAVSEAADEAAVPPFTKGWFFSNVQNGLVVIVMIALQVDVFPATSVTLIRTVLVPTFAQLKEEGVAVNVTGRHASVEPWAILFTFTVVRILFPCALRPKVRLLHTAVGGWLSTTVSVKEQLDELPEASVAI